MSPERNELCPCGSGKKYKKCCGAAAVEQDPVARNRTNAYTGYIGGRRRQFCENYAAYKKEVLARGEKMLRDKVVAEGASISCKKGCGKCCSLYVFSTLQEAECITHYLYQHDDLLQHFVKAYRDWRKNLGLFTHKMPRLDHEFSKHMAGSLSPQERERFNSDMNGYIACNAPCPFLIENACSIYEVRPFVCAGLVATTPAEKCSWDESGTSEAKYTKFEINLKQEMPYFMPIRNPFIFGCMPELVHRIVEEGYSFLANIEGLEKLKP